ncbi:MAG: hypothetical protein H7Z21_04920 [Hymenobacter sp.]|nr:hypothetical protein [Hymenobacter sp.]
MKKQAYAVFDVGRTAKRLLLFDDHRQLLDEHSYNGSGAFDYDSEGSEDLSQLARWVRMHWERLLAHPRFYLRGVNFSAYSAGMVHLDAAGEPLLASRAKLHSPVLVEDFYSQLDSCPPQAVDDYDTPTGLELYLLKHTRPREFACIYTSLPLANYLSYLLTGEKFSDYSSVSCHPELWNHEHHAYHDWVDREDLRDKLAPLTNDPVAALVEDRLVGVGLHDRTAALLAYAHTYAAPFILVSIEAEDVAIIPIRPPVFLGMSARAGYSHFLNLNQATPTRLRLTAEHNAQLHRIGQRFGLALAGYQALAYPSPETEPWEPAFPYEPFASAEAFERWNLSPYLSAAEAYQTLVHGLVQRLCTEIEQTRRTEKHLLVEGWPAHNMLFMQHLAWALPGVAVSAPTLPHAAALGALLYLEQGEASKKQAYLLP